MVRYENAGLHIDSGIPVEDVSLFGLMQGYVRCKTNSTWGWGFVGVRFKWGWWYLCDYMDAMKIDGVCLQYDNSVPAQPQLCRNRH